VRGALGANRRGEGDHQGACARVRARRNQQSLAAREQTACGPGKMFRRHHPDKEQLAPLLEKLDGFPKQLERTRDVLAHTRGGRFVLTLASSLA